MIKSRLCRAEFIATIGMSQYKTLIEMNITKTNKNISYSLIIINAFYFPLTLTTLISGKSFLGYGLGAISFVSPIHLLLVSSLLTLKIKFTNNKVLFASNIIGLIYTLFISIIYLIIYFGQEKCIS